MKDHKKISEQKHKMVQKLLVKTFPDCEVKYDGVEGVDHKIIYKGKTTTIETKTCKKLIRGDVKLPVDESPYMLQSVRFGRILFHREDFYPYHESQHDDLVKNEGWYIFVIGDHNRLITGAPACDIDRIFKDKHKTHQIAWYKILALCHPDWLETLKKQVYGE